MMPKIIVKIHHMKAKNIITKHSAKKAKYECLKIEFVCTIFIDYCIWDLVEKAHQINDI